VGCECTYCDVVMATFQAEQQNNGEGSVMGDAPKGRRRMSFWGQKQDDDRCIVVEQIVAVTDVRARYNLC
jgi:hypothetical protein